MSKYVRYPSIENHYQTKHVMRWLNEFPELENEKFWLFEKIDGANIQLYFEPNQVFKVGKRSGFINEQEKFYGIWDVLKKYEQQIKDIQTRVDKDGPITLYGEIFGEGVQKRIKYFDYKDLIFFDVLECGKFWDAKPANDLLVDFGLPVVPSVQSIQGLSNALNISADIRSKINPSVEAEGLIAKPDREFVNKLNQRLIFKIKSELFAEKMYNRAEPKKEPMDPVVYKYFSEFSALINKNRVTSIMSQNGQIQRPQEIGQYIKLVLADAKTDFLKEHDVSHLEDKQLKQIYNVGHKITPLLKEYL